MSGASDYDPPLRGESKFRAVVKRAHDRYKKCSEWNKIAYAHAKDDYKFVNGDTYNMFQWPDAISQQRPNSPNLTVNQVRQHNLHIKNDAKQNKSQVKYGATGDGATKAAAQVWEGLYRHIQNISNGQMAQGVAIDFQIDTGLGFTRITADFVDQKSFDQEIFIRSVPNPWSCYLDCDAVELDGSDARYGFIFADRPRDEMEEKYPDLKGMNFGTNDVDADDQGWVKDDYIRECEYYEVTEEKDELLGDDNGNTIMKSEAPADLVKAWEDQAEEAGSKLKRRPVVRKSVHWYKIAGSMVVEDTDVPGNSVPIIPWVGEVTIIDQSVDRKGHTRALISAQQMLNYNWSAAVENGALSAKSPWLAPVSAIEGYETYWQTANTVNHSVLPWNNKDDEGNDVPPPQRQDPPQTPTAFTQGAEMANNFMMAASGQYQADLGASGNEKSGKAINERQRQSDRATYHFVDYQALAIRRQGQIVLEWAPVIYDTKRVLRIIGEDGSENPIQVDPDSSEAHEIKAAQTIFNPNVGRYEVVSDVGPDYATQRQEAYNAIVQVLTQAPQLIDKIGDLLFKVAEFPLADEIAERLKPGMAPEAQKAISGLQVQLQKQNKLLGETMQALTEERLKVKAKDANADIDSYKADTDRLKALQPMLGDDPMGVRVLVHQLVREALANPLNGVVAASAPDLTSDATGGDVPGNSAQLPLQQRTPNPAQSLGAPGS